MLWPDYMILHNQAAKTLNSLNIKFLEWFHKTGRFKKKFNFIEIISPLYNEMQPTSFFDTITSSSGELMISEMISQQFSINSI